MTSVFHKTVDEITVTWVMETLSDRQAEVLYLVNDECLWGMISWGDLFRFLEKRKTYLVNENFTAINHVDDIETKKFFDTHPTIHELPIVDRQGILLGVCRKEDGNRAARIKDYRNHAEKLYCGIDAYWKKCIEKFINSFHGTILTMGLPEDLEVLKYLSEEERIRFEKNTASPLEILLSMSRDEEQIYWGNEYREGISKEFVQEFQTLNHISSNGVIQFYNKEKNQCFMFQEGLRCVPNAKKTNRKIYLIGPCTIFGAYVTDNQTVEYYLQEKLNIFDYKYQVMNGGALGLYKEFQYLFTKPMNEEDIVVIFAREHSLTDALRSYKQVHDLGSLSDIYKKLDNPLTCILDNFRHVNYRVNQLIAERVFSELIPFLDRQKVQKTQPASPIQNYFISWEIYEYYKKFAMKYKIDHLQGEVGAIVMNCNPFTKGHRYLIEYAARRVDKLLIFVVEEDLSTFSYKDRFAMVQLGTEDIENVTVLPSGKYNISRSTFAQYFEKDKPIECVDSMEYDCRIFGEVIAPIMNISCRFVGEEPQDIVTANYNQTMKDIFPLYGLELFEIPRKKEENGQDVISASRVRKALQVQSWEEIERLLPESSIRYIKEHALCQKFQ